MEQSSTLSITSNIGVVSAICNMPGHAEALIVLAHGAGAGMRHIFMEELAAELANQNIGTLRFNFPYMEKGKKFPGSPREAVETIKEVANYAQQKYPELPLYLAGKSYGGRMASHLMAKEVLEYVKGIIYYGFPLHAPGKPGIERAQHLKLVEVPMLFLQGKNDKLASLSLIENVARDLNATSLIVFDHADHSFKRPKKVSAESLIPELAFKTKDWVIKINQA